MSSYPFVQAYHDRGVARGPRLGFLVHMAEGGGTVEFLRKANRDGVSVHYVIDYHGLITQMLLESHMHTSIRTTAIRKTDDGDGFYGRTAALAVLGEWADTARTLGPNHATIAVELEGFAALGPNPAQRAALSALVAGVRSRHAGIRNLGHRDFADYKACPGRLIPWPSIGGHARQEDAMGLSLTLPGIPVSGSLKIAAGADAIRVSDGAHYTVPELATRPTYVVQLAPAGSVGYLVDLDGDVAHFLRASEPVTFSPAIPPVVDCDDVVTHELEAAAVRAAEAVRTRP